ncbi:MAG: hypothetical protein IH873_07965 [Chloroflexi bacterium]|nr:hypothetical protein [Chloroflexota bacterium]
MRIVVFLGMSLALAFFAVGIVGPAALEVGEARPSQPKKSGGGSAAVVAPPGSDVTDVAWVLDTGNSSLVASVELTFAGDLAEDSFVCAQVTDTSPAILANGCATLSDGLFGGVPVTVNFGVPPATAFSASAADITSVSVTVIQPVASDLDGPNGIEVIDVAWDLLDTDTTLVKEVKVTLVGVTEGEAFKVHMTLKDDADNELQRVTGLAVTGTGTTRSVTWNLTLNGDPVGAVYAALITGFQIQVTPD